MDRFVLVLGDDNDVVPRLTSFLRGNLLFHNTRPMLPGAGSNFGVSVIEIMSENL